MPAQNTSIIKDRIVSFVERNGPSLPVHIAKDAGSSILFTSAFLSELFSEKRLKMSVMRIGSSPLYYIEGQEPQLEKFAHHLKSKEKESFILLKEKKFLKDSEQPPAIRVAIRSINDFAMPYLKNKELFWRFFTATETDFPQEEKPAEIILPKVEVKEVKVETIEPIKEPVKEIIIEKPKAKAVKKTNMKKKSKKSDDKFLDRVKEFLSKSSTEITSIEGLKKDELILKVKKEGKESILVAYNKKKITEKDIVNAAKKASTFGLRYSVLSLDELPKKVSELIRALENIENIGKVE